MRPIDERDGVAACSSCSSGNSQRTIGAAFTRLRSRTEPALAQEDGGETENATAGNPGMGGVKVIGAGHLENVGVEGFGTGLMADNAEVSGSKIRLRRNQIGIDRKNSQLNIDDLTIE